jgi:hypothetical protein
MSDRSIKLYVNERDLAIIKKAIHDLIEKTNKDTEEMYYKVLPNSFKELKDYMNCLYSKVDDLSSRHLYEPK